MSCTAFVLSIFFLILTILAASTVLSELAPQGVLAVKKTSFNTVKTIPVVKCHIICKIMPLGDSITYGHGSTHSGGYRFPLWNDLEALDARITFVGSMQSGPAGFPRNHQGLPRWKINQLAAHVVGWLKTYQPQIILLHIGTNDFDQNDDPTNAPARLKNLINLITATVPDATLIVAQIIPLILSPQINAEVMNYNRAIPAIVQADQAQGKHVQFVDMYHAVSPSLIPDHVHPNDRGYELMAKVWEEALIALLNINPRMLRAQAV